MTEQTEFSYAKTLQNTLEQNEIMRMAHGVIQANVSKPELVKSNIKSIREKLTSCKLPQLKTAKSKLQKLEQANKYLAQGDFVKARIALNLVKA